MSVSEVEPRYLISHYGAGTLCPGWENQGPPSGVECASGACRWALPCNPDSYPYRGISGELKGSLNNRGNVQLLFWTPHQIDQGFQLKKKINPALWPQGTNVRIKYADGGSLSFTLRPACDGPKVAWWISLSTPTTQKWDTLMAVRRLPCASAECCLECNEGRRLQLMELISRPAGSNYHVIFCTHSSPTLATLPTSTLWSRALIRDNKKLNNKRGFLILHLFCLSTVWIFTLFQGLQESTTSARTNKTEARNQTFPVSRVRLQNLTARKEVDLSVWRGFSAALARLRCC